MTTPNRSLPTPSVLSSFTRSKTEPYRPKHRLRSYDHDGLLYSTSRDVAWSAKEVDGSELAIASKRHSQLDSSRERMRDTYDMPNSV